MSIQETKMVFNDEMKQVKEVDLTKSSTQPAQQATPHTIEFVRLPKKKTIHLAVNHRVVCGQCSYKARYSQKNDTLICDYNRDHFCLACLRDGFKGGHIEITY